MDDDSNNTQPWTLAVQIPGTLVHAAAILATIFRLLYRWHLSRLWWEDTWAALALICDIGCLAGIWMQTAPDIMYTTPQINVESNWLVSLTLTSVLWFARMSILCSVVRIANPAPKLRHIAYCIGVMFVTMEVGLLAQKIFICMENSCWVINSVAVTQLVTDIISDTILVAAPVLFLRDVKLRRDCRVLIISAFSASILITGVTILHSVLLFRDAANITIIIGHVKAALALFVCNALILVTFIYRLCHKSGVDFECSMAQGSGIGNNVVELTSVIDLPSNFSTGVYPVTSGLQNMSVGSELDLSHTGRAAALSDTEDSRCDHHVCKVGDAGDE